MVSQNYGMKSALLFCFGLIDRKSRYIVMLFVFVALALNILDLIALSIVSYCVSILNGSTPETSFLFTQTSKIFAAFIDTSPLNPFQNLNTWATIAGFLVLLKSVLSIALMILTTRFFARKHTAVSQHLGDKFTYTSYDTMADIPPQEAAFALNHGVYYSVNAFLNSFVQVIVETASLLGITLFLISIYPLQTLIIIIYFSVIFLISFIPMGRLARVYGDQGTRSYIEAQSLVIDSIRNIKELRASDQIRKFGKRINAQVQKTAFGYAKQNLLSQLPKFVFESALFLIVITLVAYSSSHDNPKDYILLLSIFMIFGIRIIPSFIRFQGGLITLNVMLPNVKRLQEFSMKIVDLESRSTEFHRSIGVFGRELQKDINRGKFLPSVQISHLSFKFEGKNEFLFENLSLQIKPYTSVSIVGPSGVGKSTLADLIIGIRRPTAGIIQIGNQPAESVSSIWPGKIAYASQRIALVRGSLVDNVSMHQGEEDLDFAWISTLIEELGLTDIQSRVENDKSLANLGDDAIKLSGGQRQRLAIARALYLRPKLLILDEVTSFQDGKSELSILEFLKTVMRDMTTIIISHKPTTIDLSDFVYKISDKSVVELI